MKYLKKFDEHSKYAQFIETDEFIKPNVSGCEFGDEVHYNDEEHDYSKDYLTFTALEDGTFTMKIGYNVTDYRLNYIEYSIDEGETWVKTNNITNQTVTITTPTINAGNNILWRGNGGGTGQPGKIGLTSGYYSYFSSTGKCNVSGNINTLVKLDNPNSASMNESMYMGLFINMTNLINAENLILPNTVQKYCYDSMFSGCTSLITTPMLQASSLFYGCYEYMFEYCSSLSKAPKLPALSLASNCYSVMFRGCTSLKTAPELNATELSTYSYQQMFNSCTSLNYIKALLITTPSSSYTNNWLYNIAPTGIFVKNINATWDTVEDYNGVPSGWTILYFDPATEKYYLSDKTTECDDHGNVL